MSNNKPASTCLLALGLTAIGGAVYYASKKFLTKRGEEDSTEPVAPTDGETSVAAVAPVDTADIPAEVPIDEEEATSSMSEELRIAVEQWLLWDPNPESKAEVERLYLEKNYEKLAAHFLPRIAFGTAGLRSSMTYGYKHMNELIIIQATQGLCTYMEQAFPEDIYTKGIVIGYDIRHNSKKFAEIAAAVFLSRGIKVHWFNDYTCTPFVAYGVTACDAKGGLMITASHNPKNDNGYKVYWNNGCQIIPPTDVSIANSILTNLQPWSDNYTFDATSEHLVDVTDMVASKYYNDIREQTCFHYDANADTEFKVTYTAMHGVGAKFVQEAFRAFNLPPYIPTPEQVQPDPEFSTVAFPNPEEGKGALELAMKAADANGSTVILANDPDADRLAVAVKKDDTWVILTGNEIAAVFADWSWFNWKRNNPDTDPKDCFMVASAVSSKHLAAMAKKEGFQFTDTLTGFKWIGNEANRRAQLGGTCLLAYEVEIGFLVGNVSFDKDGVRTAAIMYEAANYWNTQGQSLLDRVEHFYNTYGTFKMINSYYVCADPAIFEDIFTKLRTNTADDAIVTFDGSVRYPGKVGNYTIASVRDVSKGYDTSYEDGKLRLPQMTDAHMLTFTFTNGSVATLRNSGTEPKLKFYVESSDEDTLNDLTKSICIEFIDAINRKLVPKSDFTLLNDMM